MKLGTTLNEGKLPAHQGMLLECPVNLEKGYERQVIWQFLLAWLWVYIGTILGERLVIPLVLVPAWAVFSAWLWPIVPIYFAVQFVRHYAAICTTTVGLEWRADVREGKTEGAIIRSVGFPLIFPWLAVWYIREFPEVVRAWVYWFAYNRQKITAPEALVSPAGSQPVRVWTFRFCTLIVSAVSPIHFFTLILFTSLVIAPALNELREQRDA